MSKVTRVNCCRSALIGVALLFSGSLVAGPYIAVGASLLSFDDRAEAAEPVNALLRAGYAFNRHFEIGGELGYTVIEDDVFDIDYDVDTRFIFTQANIVMDSGTKLYLMIGRSEVTLDSTSGPVDFGGEDSGTGYGIGLQFPGGNNNYGAIEYINYYDSEFDDIFPHAVVDGINFSYVKYFN